MTLEEKVQILADAAKYDVSCSSSGSSRANTKNGLGNGAMAGICHSWADDGRCISLLKILFSNVCVYDCVYCGSRKSNPIARATFTVSEIVSLTINFYKRNYIEGLFLSSGVVKSPDYTMEKLVQVVKRLRIEENFNGYIHLKIVPGATQELIQEAGLYADRVSVNLELPSSASLAKLAPQKDKKAIMSPMHYIGNKVLETKEERKKQRKSKPPVFVPAGQTTQLIVGASPESDRHILMLSENLYSKMNLKRVYYSAYIPINNDSRLPAIYAPPMLRENRLYQADWLLRFYGFRADELLEEENPFFDELLDPKTDWALRNLHLFPVEINRIDYEMLLKVPGIGHRSAAKIVHARRQAALDFDHLKAMRVVLKRAKFFITCKGKTLERLDLHPFNIRTAILGHKARHPDDCYSLF